METSSRAARVSSGGTYLILSAGSMSNRTPWRSGQQVRDNKILPFFISNVRSIHPNLVYCSEGYGVMELRILVLEGMDQGLMI